MVQMSVIRIPTEIDSYFDPSSLSKRMFTLTFFWMSSSTESFFTSDDVTDSSFNDVALSGFDESALSASHESADSVVVAAAADNDSRVLRQC